MDTNLLIITGQREFEQLLRLTLDDLDSRLLHYASSDEEALRTAAIHPPAILLIDAGSVNESSNLAQELLQAHPDCKLILVPPANDPRHPSIRDLQPDEILSRPFIKEDLLEIIAELSGGKISPVTSTDRQESPQESTSLLADLKDQLETVPEAFPQISTVESLSLEQELDQVLSKNYDRDHELEDDTSSADLEDKPDDHSAIPQETDEEEKLLELEDTAIVHVSEGDHIDLPPLDESGDEDEILTSVLAQLESQTIPDTKTEDEDYWLIEDIINEENTEEIDPELDALLNELDQPESIEQEITEPFEEDTESESVPTLVPDVTPVEEHQAEPPEELEETEYVWDLKAKLPLPHNKERSTDIPPGEETGQDFQPPSEPDAETTASGADVEEQLEVEKTESAVIEMQPPVKGNLEKLKSALEQNQTTDFTAVLEAIANEYDLPGLLLFFQSAVISNTGLFTALDIREIETMLEQAWKNKEQIDIARFLKLGDPQEKYLLYAAPISGALGLCTVSLTRKQLSEIRSHTLWIAQQLQIEEKYVQQFPYPEIGRRLEEDTAIEFPVEQDSEETPHTTLDELLSEETPQEISESTDDYDEWVHEMPESEEEPSVAQDQMSESAWREEDIEPAASDEEDIEPILETPEGQIPLERAEPEHLESVQAMDQADDDLQISGEIETDAVSSRSRSKIGQGRIKLRKSSIERASMHQWDEEVMQNKFLLVYKPLEYDEEKTANPMHKPGSEPLDKPETGWKPAPQDPLKRIRHRLKNQKIPPQVKIIQSESKQIAFLKGKKSIKQEIRPSAVFHSLDKSAETASAADQIEAPVLEEQPPVSIPIETIVEGETQTAPEAKEHEDWISPPETLEAAPEELAGELSDSPPVTLQAEDQIDFRDSDAEEQSPAFLTEDEEDEVVIIEENLDLLKELAEDMRFDGLGLDEDEDADTFFEAYMRRAGEQIEEEVRPEESQESLSLEQDSEVDQVFTEPVPSVDLQSTEQTETEEEDESTDTETGPQNEFVSSEEVDHSEFVELLRSRLSDSETDIETLEPHDIDEEFSQTVISLQENKAVEEESPEEETRGVEPGVLKNDSISPVEEFNLEDFPVFEETLEEDELLSSLEEGSPLETWEDVEEEPEIETEPFSEEMAAEIEEALYTTEEPPESEEDIRKILHEVLAQEDAHVEVEPEKPATIEQEPEILPLSTEEQSLEKEIGVVEAADSSLDAELLPWETEGDYAEDNIEITPTPNLLAEEDQSADVLVDLLADTRLDPLSLNLEQPLYTCILVPELTEFSLNSKIAGRIKEWLPRLSRVFGWQFVNIHVQPTYLQWTVRVPAGTSQGSIVRKVRQQTSLRIFEEFPELKQLSHSGNFWAKGYLVVSGSNPPPAEFLDDFIQKNRRPKGLNNP